MAKVNTRSATKIKGYRVDMPDSNTDTEEYEFTAITRYDGFFVKNS